MRKADIVDYLTSNTSLSRSQAITAIDSVFEAIEKSLCKDESVYIRGFATIKVYHQREKSSQHQ